MFRRKIILQSPICSVYVTVFAVIEKKKGKQRLQSASYLQVQELGAYYYEIAKNKINKQACMIIFMCSVYLQGMASL